MKNHFSSPILPPSKCSRLRGETLSKLFLNALNKSCTLKFQFRTNFFLIKDQLSWTPV